VYLRFFSFTLFLLLIL